MNHLRAQIAVMLALGLAVAQVIAEEIKLPGERVENGRVVRVNDMDMYYEVHGEGPPLVLLHGYLGTGYFQWKAYVAEFGKEYQLILPDLRGHGRTNDPSGKFTHRQAALDVLALLDAMNTKKFRGMGVSSGSHVLLHMATQQPDRVEAAVFAGGASYLPAEARAVFSAITYDGLPGIDKELWESLRRLHGEDKLRSLVDNFRNLKDNYDDVNFTPPFLATIRARSLIFHGDRDISFPVAIPVEMYRSIPNSYLWIVPNGGHVPCFGPSSELDEEKAYFAKKVLEFLRGDWEKNNKPR